MSRDDKDKAPSRGGAPGVGLTSAKGASSQTLRRHAAHFIALKEIRVPWVTRALAIILVLTITGAACFLIFVPWVQTATGFGQVTALDPRDRQQPINALVSGLIERWYVRDGSRVAAGDPILRIVDNDPQLVERLTAEQAALEQRLEAAKAAARTAQLDLSRQERLFEEGLSSQQDLENARIRLEDLRARVAEAEAQLSRANVNISRQSRQVVRAPRDGTIISVSSGGTATFVREGQQVATFLPDGGERVVEMMIDGRDISLVVEGRKVRLQFEGWPAVQLSGWPSLAVGTFGGVVAFVEPSAMQGGQFRILVSQDPEEEVPWPDARFVRFGAQARGWVVLDTVSVGYELWRRLNNFPPNFTGAQTSSQEQANAPQ